MLEPVTTVKWVLEVLPRIIEVDLIAAQKLHVRTCGGGHVHVGSSDCAVRIFMPEETGAEHHDESRIGWTRQTPRNCFNAGVGFPLSTDSQRQPVTCLLREIVQLDALVADAEVAVGSVEVGPVSSIQRDLVWSILQHGSSWIEVFVDGRDPDDRVIRKNLVRDDEKRHR